MNAARAETIPRAANPRRGVESKPHGALTAVTALIGISASIVAILLLFTFPGHWPALAGALLIACVSPGAAVMCWVDSEDGVVQAGLTLTISLAVTAIVTAVMLWMTAWHPKALLAVTVLSVLSCAIRVWRGGLPTWTVPSARGQRLWARLIPLIVGLAAWSYGISKVQVESISPYGLLASANIWYFLGLALLLGGGLAELLSGTPRAWLLITYVVALMVVIYATVPILFKVPEYEWVYKHIGIIQSFSTYGKITDPSNIYDQWPALFTAVASVSGLAKMGPLSFAAWGPLAFELADGLLLLGIFRMLTVNRRAAYLALFLYEGFIAWVGQDYLSPQAFGYLLWLGIATIIVRWLLVPARDHRDGGERTGRISRLRARLLTGMPRPPAASPMQRGLAFTMVIVLYFAIVAAHQLTPYMVIVQVGGLVVLGVLWRGWKLTALLIALAVIFLLPRYGLIASQYGGLFSGGNAVDNASGIQGTTNYGAHEFSGKVVDILGVILYLPAVVSILRHRRALGQVAIPAILAFTPILVVFGQDYGGEAIYRVYMFSAAWCTILIANSLVQIRATVWRRVLVSCTWVVTVLLGMQGNYASLSVDGFTSQDLSASLWLYAHTPSGSMFVLAANDFPTLEAPDYRFFNSLIIPDFPTEPGMAWLTDANVAAVDKWIASFHYTNTYVIFSRRENAYAVYYDDPVGMAKMEKDVAHAPGWTAVYHNSDVMIYRVMVGN
ncbi:MAG: hypothetical protein ABSA02_03275 [Trebonia sp.]|jgi:hypothetical protein